MSRSKWYPFQYKIAIFQTNIAIRFGNKNNIEYLSLALVALLICIIRMTYLLQEEIEDIKGAIRIRISKKNRQHNGQKKKDKQHWPKEKIQKDNYPQNIHIKLKIEWGYCLHNIILLNFHYRLSKRLTLRLVHNSSSLSPVFCSSAHVLFTLFVFACVQWCLKHIVLCFWVVFLRLVCPVLSASLDCLVLITTSVFSNVYL